MINLCFLGVENYQNLDSEPLKHYKNARFRDSKLTKLISRKIWVAEKNLTFTYLGGAIIFTSSLAGLTGVYGLSAYCGSKFAIRGYAESLAMGKKFTVFQI